MNALLVQQDTKQEANKKQQFSSDQLRALKDLWNDEAVQKVYERRAEFNLNDSTK